MIVARRSNDAAITFIPATLTGPDVNDGRLGLGIKGSKLMARLGASPTTHVQTFGEFNLCSSLKFSL